MENRWDFLEDNRIVVVCLACRNTTNFTITGNVPFFVESGEKANSRLDGDYIERFMTCVAELGQYISDGWTWEMMDHIVETYGKDIDPGINIQCGRCRSEAIIFRDSAVCQCSEGVCRFDDEQCAEHADLYSPPGCYMCLLVGSWEETIRYCAACYTINREQSGREPFDAQCESCMFYYGRKAHDITEEEIRNYAKGE